MSEKLKLVAGLGKTGLSIAHYLKLRNKPFVLFDTRHHPSSQDEFKAQFPGVDIYLDEYPADLLDKVDEIICSPGVPLDIPLLENAREKNIPIIGDIECLARESKIPIIAITGTNGKSTVTSLVGEITKQAGLKVAVAGNIGSPVLALLDGNEQYDVWVLELSSFQLDLTYTLAPVAATILNITPDHLDRHHHFDAYNQAKQRVYSHAKYLIYNRQDQRTCPAQTNFDQQGVLISFGLDKPHQGTWGIIEDQGISYLSYGDKRLLDAELLKIKGKHNWANALAAAALSHAFGIELEVIAKALQNFSGLPHRSQWVRTLDGVEWINDSKGTNIGATLSAIAGLGPSLEGKIILIAGGQGKGADFTELRPVVADHVRTIILIGEDAYKIEEALQGSVELIHAKKLEEAVNLAKSKALSGDAVLLSPACASLDMFKDFNHRGELFTQAVNAL